MDARSLFSAFTTERYDVEERIDMLVASEWSVSGLGCAAKGIDNGAWWLYPA